MIQGPAAGTLDLELGELAHPGEQAAAMAATVVVEHGVQPCMREGRARTATHCDSPAGLTVSERMCTRGLRRTVERDVLQAQKNRLGGRFF